MTESAVAPESKLDKIQDLELQRRSIVTLFVQEKQGRDGSGVFYFSLSLQENPSYGRILKMLRGRISSLYMTPMKVPVAAPNTAPVMQ